MLYFGVQQMGRDPEQPHAVGWWRLVYEVEARPDVGLLWIHKICVAPDRASDAPENPYAD